METDVRMRGGVPLNMHRPTNHRPFRWHKRMGEPTCLIEWLLQNSWLLVPYIALVVTLILVFQIVYRV